MTPDQSLCVIDHMDKTKKELMGIIRSLLTRVAKLENAMGLSEHIILSPEDWEKFTEVLANPPKPTKALVEAVKRHKKLVKPTTKKQIKKMIKDLVKRKNK